MNILTIGPFGSGNDTAVELTDGDLELIKNALTNCANLCETDSKNFIPKSPEATLFLESAASYRATLAKLEGE